MTLKAKVIWDTDFKIQATTAEKRTEAGKHHTDPLLLTEQYVISAFWASGKKKKNLLAQSEIGFQLLKFMNTELSSPTPFSVFPLNPLLPIHVQILFHIFLEASRRLFFPFPFEEAGMMQRVLAESSFIESLQHITGDEALCFWVVN